MKLPVYTWLPRYDTSWIRGDVVAGLTVWAVLVPEALAYATIAGVAGGRALRGAGCAAPLCGFRQLASARCRADGLDRGALGGSVGDLAGNDADL